MEKKREYNSSKYFEMMEEDWKAFQWIDDETGSWNLFMQMRFVDESKE